MNGENEQLERKIAYVVAHIKEQFEKARDEGRVFDPQTYLDRFKNDLDDAGIEKIKEDLRIQGVTVLVEPVVVAPTAPEAEPQKKRREVRYEIGKDRKGKPVVLEVEIKDGEEKSYPKRGMHIPDGIVGTDRESEYLELLNEVEETLRREIDDKNKIVNFSYVIDKKEYKGEINIPEEFHGAIPLFQAGRGEGVLTGEEKRKKNLFKKWYLNEVKNQAMNAAVAEFLKPAAPAVAPADTAPVVTPPPESADDKRKREAEAQKQEWKKELEEMQQKIEAKYDELKNEPGFGSGEKIYKDLTWEQLKKATKGSVESGADEFLFEKARERLDDILLTFEGQLAIIKDKKKKNAEARPVAPPPPEAAPAVAPPAAEARESEPELKAELDAARQEYVKAKADKEKYAGLMGTVRDFLKGNVSANTKILVEEALEKAEKNYQEAREKYVEADVNKMLDERVALVDARAELVAGKKTWIGKMYDGYKWLGKLNAVDLGWIKPTSGAGKFIGRMASVRTVVSFGLLGAGFLAGGGVGAGLAFGLRRILSGAGGAAGSYDLMDAMAHKWGKSLGRLRELSEERLSTLSSQDLLERLATFEVEAQMHGKKLSESEGFEEYRKAQEMWKTKFAQEKLQEKIDEIDKVADKQEKQSEFNKKIRGGVAIGVGLAIGTGEAQKLIGEAWHKIFGETGMPAPENADITKRSFDEINKGIKLDIKVPPVVHLPPELKGIDLTDLSQEKINTLMDHATVGHHEGVTHAIMRQLEDNPEKFGFKGDIHNQIRLDNWAKKMAAKIAEKEGYIKPDGSETWIREGKNIRFFLTQDAHGVNHIVSSEEALAKGTMYNVSTDQAQAAREAVLHPKVGGLQAAVEHPPAGHGAGAVGAKPAEAAHEDMLKRLSPAEHNAYLAAEKNFDKMVHQQLGLNKGEYYSPHPEVDASGHMFDSHSGKITVMFESEPIDVRLINGRIAGFQDPIDHHWNFISSEKAIKGAKALAEKIYNEGYLNWNKSLARVLDEGGLKLTKTDWFDETRETFLGKDYNGILKLENLKEYGARFLDVHVKDGRLWKIGENEFLDNQETISLKSPNFAKRLLEIVGRRIPVGPEKAA